MIRKGIMGIMGRSGGMRKGWKDDQKERKKKREGVKREMESLEGKK